VLCAYLDSLGVHTLLLHGNLGPLDDRLDVIAAVAVAFTLLCFIGYLGVGRRNEPVTVSDDDNES